MAEVVVVGPFEELDRRDQLRLQPVASLHVLCGQALAPAAFSRLGKIAEWAFGDRQTLEI
jgi:hypothetical protein